MDELSPPPSRTPLCSPAKHNITIVPPFLLSALLLLPSPPSSSFEHSASSSSSFSSSRLCSHCSSCGNSSHPVARPPLPPHHPPSSPPLCLPSPPLPSKQEKKKLLVTRRALTLVWRTYRNQTKTTIATLPNVYEGRAAPSNQYHHAAVHAMRVTQILTLRFSVRTRPLTPAAARAARLCSQRCNRHLLSSTCFSSQVSRKEK